MKLTIVCAGRIKEKYLSAGIAEFMKRLRPFAQVEIREIHEEKMPDEPSAAEKEQVLHKEGEKAVEACTRGQLSVCARCIRG
jgi:23S rRNA (pseudouridine1915-N3)-methyltransferase